jgi:hypothetical protein
MINFIRRPTVKIHFCNKCSQMIPPGTYSWNRREYTEGKLYFYCAWCLGFFLSRYGSITATGTLGTEELLSRDFHDAQGRLWSSGNSISPNYHDEEVLND